MLYRSPFDKLRADGCRAVCQSYLFTDPKHPGGHPRDLAPDPLRALGEGWSGVDGRDPRGTSPLTQSKKLKLFFELLSLGRHTGLDPVSRTLEALTAMESGFQRNDGKSKLEHLPRARVGHGLPQLPPALPGFGFTSLIFRVPRLSFPVALPFGLSVFRLVI